MPRKQAVKSQSRSASTTTGTAAQATESNSEPARARDDEFEAAEAMSGSETAGASGAKSGPSEAKGGAARAKRSRARKPTSGDSEVVEPTTRQAEADAEIERTSPRRKARRSKRSSEEHPEAVAGHGGEIELPVPTWRQPKRLAAKQQAKEAGSRREPDQELAEQPEHPKVPSGPEATEEQRPKGDRRKARPRRPAEEAAAGATAGSTKPVAAPPKPLIPVPEDAPRVVTRNGIPTLVRNGRAVPPIAFFGSAPDERRAETVLGEIRLAADAGIHLHIHLIEFEVDRRSVASAVEHSAYMLAKTVDTDPEAAVIFRLVIAAPPGWEAKYPDAKYYDTHGRLAEPSVCDEAFWGEARACLEDYVRQIRMLALRQHVIGVHLDRGEWFFAEGAGHDDSPAAVTAFRNWARTRYLDDVVALRAAWFDGQVEFSTLTVPAPRVEPQGTRKFMRVSRKERRWVDYHLFLSDATVHRISDLAYAVKSASQGYFLVGVSYGYTFEWSHPSSGHLSLGKLLRTPEIDFIAGPPSYRNREPGGAAAFPSPVDSFPLNGKLYISEEDYKTAIGGYKEPDDFNPVIRTPQALESVHWRGIGAALAHGAGVCWMDLWGNGWLQTPTIWKRGAKARELLERRMAAPLTAPDVAVFIDERALAYLVDQASFDLLVQNVRESVLRSGLSSGFYLLSDLAHREWFPESKLSIFLNAWDMRPEHRAAIKSRLQRDGKVLFWLYCAGLFDAGRESLERAREVTGIALKPQPFSSKTGTTILHRKHPLTEAFPDRGLIGGAPLDPSYFAIPEEATVLGEYSQTGLPSFVVREFTDGGDPSRTWTSVFMGEPVVTPALIRGLGILAGAHIWNYQDDVVHVRPPFLTVHCTGAGPRTITLPDNWVSCDLLAEHPEVTDTPNIRFNALDGTSHVFLAGLREDVEAFLNADVESLLSVADIEPPTMPGERPDPAALDVPIVKLDEWIEGGVPEEVSDEWFLRPTLIEPLLEREGERPEVAVGRRRRKRGQSKETKSEDSANIAFKDIGMSVRFRKRE